MDVSMIMEVDKGFEHLSKECSDDGFIKAFWKGGFHYVESRPTSHVRHYHPQIVT